MQASVISLLTTVVPAQDENKLLSGGDAESGDFGSLLGRVPDPGQKAAGDAIADAADAAADASSIYAVLVPAQLLAANQLVADKDPSPVEVGFSLGEGVADFSSKELSAADGLVPVAGEASADILAGDAKGDQLVAEAASAAQALLSVAAQKRGSVSAEFQTVPGQLPQARQLVDAAVVSGDLAGDVPGAAAPPSQLSPNADTAGILIGSPAAEAPAAQVVAAAVNNAGSQAVSVLPKFAPQLPVGKGAQRGQEGDTALRDNGDGGSKSAQDFLASLKPADASVAAVSSSGSFGDSNGGQSLAGDNASQQQPVLSGIGHAELPKPELRSHDGGEFAKHLRAPVILPAVDQVAIHLRKGVEEGAQQIQIKLEPGELGHVEIKLNVGHDGKTAVMVTAEHRDTLELLQRDAQGLARALHNAGLEADAGSLSFNLRGGQHHGDGRSQNGERGQDNFNDTLLEPGGVQGEQHYQYHIPQHYHYTDASGLDIQV